MLRPREGRDLRLISFDIETSPAAELTWADDVFGNSIATASFRDRAETLVIESKVKLERDALAWPVFDIAASAISYPFSYSEAERIDLGALASPQYPDADGSLGSWARGHVRGNPTDTLSLLKDLNSGIGASTAYDSREEEGTQAPLDTLARGAGSCRDLAVLFVEAARTLGFGARIVSGYLYDGDGNDGTVGSAGRGSTHAWADIYVPGAGWIAFDPTNGRVGGHNLIPVAVARDISGAVPVIGSFVGDADDFLGMTVEVAAQTEGP
jgi:transglutaminase-like putative cysteine protease